MADTTERIAWVAVPSQDEIRERLPHDTRYPYDFGFFPGMTRLSRAHKRIGSAMGPLVREIMFAPGHLTRPEREMIAAVASAEQDCHF